MLVAVLSLFLFGSLVAAASVFIMLPSALLKNSESMTQELSDTILTTLRYLMMRHEQGVMQSIFDALSDDKDTISTAFIINSRGRIVYSTDKAEVGTVLDHFKEKSCIICHDNKNKPPSQKTVMIKNMRGDKVFRNISIILNDSVCHACHPKEAVINGKIIIDRPLKNTEAIIRRVEIIILGFGAVCLILVIASLTKVINKYIFEILKQHHEITLLYSLIERLSKTIDVEELKIIVIDIIRETINADKVIIVLPRENRQYRAYIKEAGKDKLIRTNVQQNETLIKLIDEWHEGNLDGIRMSRDKKEIYMGIRKNDKLLALIVCQKFIGRFNEKVQGIVSAISSHIVIAFENAYLYKLAITDELTGLYTQRHFRYIIEREFINLPMYKDGISLVMIDIDNFKKVNDTYGHVAGDMVIKGVANHIRNTIRDNDMSFRYGGEEFTVLLSSTDIERGCRIADRIRKNIENAVFEDGTLSLKVTISVGVANCPKNADTVRELIINADNALYEAKRLGKNVVIRGEVKTNGS